MTMLLDHVRATGALAPEAIDAAVQRQRIYGGSFDTALLELELVEPAALDTWLVAATGLQAAPHALLKPGPTRPWDVLPAEVLGTGWVMPLAIERGRPQLVVHPEIPDTQLTGLRRAVPNADVFVTAECCLARIASERSAAVVPQRYAVLSVAYVQSLRRASPETKPHPAAAPATPPIAPWLTTGSATVTAATAPVPAATAPEPDAPTPRTAPAQVTTRVAAAPPLVFNPPAAQPDSAATREHTGPRVQAPPVRSAPPAGASGTASPLRFAPPPTAGSVPSQPAANSSPGARAPLAIPVANTMAGFTSDARSHAATPVIIADVPSQVVFVAPLRERLDLPRRELALAADRDAITDTLLRCAAEFSRRCALFGVKREGLRGLEGPEGSIAVEDLVVPIDDMLERALAGTTQILTSRHAPLANAVKQAREVPCIFEPVRVLGRSVLALYVDRDGGAISDDERALAKDLCTLASERLEVVLRKLREQSSAPTPTTQTSATTVASKSPPVGVPSAAQPAASPSVPVMHLPSMVQPAVSHTPTIPDGIRSPLAPAPAGSPAVPTNTARTPASPAPATTAGAVPTAAPEPARPAPTSAPAAAATPAAPTSTLPTLIKPNPARSSTLLGNTPAPSFSPPPRGTTLPPVSGTIQPPSAPSGPVVLPHQPSVRVTTSPSIPTPPDLVGSPAATGTSTPTNAGPTGTSAPTPASSPTEGPPAGAAGSADPKAPSRANAVTPTAPSTTIDLDAPSNMRTLDGELPPVRAGAMSASRGSVPPGSPVPASTPSTPVIEPSRPVLTIIASPPPPAPPPLPSFGSAPSSPGTLPPITVPPVRVGGAADPRRPDRIIDLATPISPKSRSVVTLDAEDRQAPAASESLVARVDDALVRIARGEERLDALLAFGDVGLRRIAQRFPGDLDVLRRDIDVLPPPSAHGPLLRTCIDLGPRVTPHLLELFDHGNAAIRFYVAFVFQELRDPQCMPRLAAACFDAETDVRTIAARVLETYSRSTGYEEAIAMVRRELANADVQRQLHATRACGTLRDIWAVPQLIDLLAHRERPMQEAALEALCTITGQQLGLKAQRWKTWYGEQGRRHRVEWLVATLEHKDVAVRRWGYDELRRITGQNIPYTPTGEPREREAGVRRWLEWWSRDGRAAMTQHGRS